MSLTCITSLCTPQLPKPSRIPLSKPSYTFLLNPAFWTRDMTKTRVRGGAACRSAFELNVVFPEAQPKARTVTPEHSQMPIRMWFLRNWCDSKLALPPRQHERVWPTLPPAFVAARGPSRGTDRASVRPLTRRWAFAGSARSSSGSAGSQRRVDFCAAPPGEWGGRARTAAHLSTSTAVSGLDEPNRSAPPFAHFSRAVRCTFFVYRQVLTLALSRRSVVCGR